MSLKMSLCFGDLEQVTGRAKILWQIIFLYIYILDEQKIVHARRILNILDSIGNRSRLWSVGVMCSYSVMLVSRCAAVLQLSFYIWECHRDDCQSKLCNCSCEVFSTLTRSLMFSLRQSFSYSSNSLRHFHTDVVFMRAEHQILV